MEGLTCADIGISEEDPVSVGTLVLRPFFTPGHTDTHHSYFLEQAGQARVFTGDALLIDGCGRTDFQNGNSETPYQALHQKLFQLPDANPAYPAHDYQTHPVRSHERSVGKEGVSPWRYR